MDKIRNLLLGTSLAVGLALAGGSAFAADLATPAAPAVAPESDPNYISVFGGYAFANNVSAYSVATSTNVTVGLNGGYVIGGAVGTHLMPNLRGEVELSYVSHGASSVFASGAGTGTATGSSNTLYLLGNLWYDIDVGNGITPYIGGGIGAAVLMPNITLDSGGTYTADALAFAGQLGAGVKFQLSDNMTLDLGYRAKGVFNGALTGSNGASNLTNIHFIDQTIQAGLTFGF